MLWPRVRRCLLLTLLRFQLAASDVIQKPPEKPPEKPREKPRQVLESTGKTAVKTAVNSRRNSRSRVRRSRISVLAKKKARYLSGQRFAVAFNGDHCRHGRSVCAVAVNAYVIRIQPLFGARTNAL